MAGPPKIRVRGIRQKLGAGNLVGRASPGGGPAQIIPVGVHGAAAGALAQGLGLAEALTVNGQAGLGAAGSPGPRGLTGPAGAAGAAAFTVAIVTAPLDIYISG